ncbi:hypothetical protein HMPRNC0000_1803 [Staphylococcus aureus]|nr:hypothetical protein HMPRNC0000_1803 [Staphylococcus aureus]
MFYHYLLAQLMQCYFFVIQHHLLLVLIVEYAYSGYKQLQLKFIIQLQLILLHILYTNFLLQFFFFLLILVFSAERAFQISSSSLNLNILFTPLFVKDYTRLDITMQHINIQTFCLKNSSRYISYASATHFCNLIFNED